MQSHSIRTLTRSVTFVSGVLAGWIFFLFLSVDPILAAEELSTSDLLKVMTANDTQLDRVLIRYEYAELTRSPLPMRLQIREPARQKHDYEYLLKVDPSIDRSSLPDAKTLFNFGSAHAEEIRSGKISDQSKSLTDQQMTWLHLLVERKISASRKRKPDPPANPRATADLAPGILAIDGRDIVVIHNPDGPLPIKFSSIGGRTTMMTSTFKDGTNTSVEWLKDSRQLSDPMDSYQELALWRLFALGVGYGSRVKEILSRESVGDQVALEVMLEIWPEKRSRAKLKIDSNQIVRQAEINAESTTIHVTTEGLRKLSADRRTATSGSFRRELKSNPNHTSPAFLLNLTSAEFGLERKKFERLADFTPPENESVSDITPQQFRSPAEPSSKRAQ